MIAESEATGPYTGGVMAMEARITKITELTVNGRRRRVSAGPDTSLLSVLREELGLTGTKYGCGEAQCGACTVLIDGKPRRSCITKLGAVGEADVKTIESLAGKGGVLHPVQQSFVDAGAMQCGFCTPGMVMSAVGLLAQNADPSEAEIVAFMDGNICRCGTYPRIVAAVRAAAVAKKGGGAMITVDADTYDNSDHEGWEILDDSPRRAPRGRAGALRARGTAPRTSSSCRGATS